MGHWLRIAGFAVVLVFTMMAVFQVFTLERPATQSVVRPSAVSPAHSKTQPVKTQLVDRNVRREPLPYAPGDTVEERLKNAGFKGPDAVHPIKVR